MFTFAIFNNGREVDNLDAGTYPTEALARDAGLVALDDLCPLGSLNRGTYRVEVRAAAKMSENMDKPGFTPGPWRFDLDAHGRGRVKGTGCWVATTWTVADDDTSERYPAEANARLIAAAPDLLAAVEMVFDAAEDNGDMEDIDWDMLRAALSRAKGGV